MAFETTYRQLGAIVVLPHFLVIGAMKCGTTTLYHDLAAHPKIKLCEKEFNLLSEPGVEVDNVRRSYAAAFRGSDQGAFRGDVSTTYAMQPDRQGVAELARRVLPSETKIVYIVREPVSRAVSHHHHMHTWPLEGKMSADIDACLHEHNQIIDYGRYAWQLQPWRACFGDNAIQVIAFEEYVRDRVGVLTKLFEWLGLAYEVNSKATSKTYNQSAGKPVTNDFWIAVQQSFIYQKGVRRLIPAAMKQAAYRWFLPKAPAQLDPPSAASVERILAAAVPDELELRALLGLNKPIWDWAKVRASYGATNSRAA